MRKRRRFTRKFKKQAISLVLDQNQTIFQAAQSLQIGQSSLSRWVSLHKKESLLKSEKQEKTQFKRWVKNSKQAQLYKTALSKAKAKNSFTELMDEQPKDEVGFELEYCQAIFRVSKNFDLDTFARCVTILKKLSC